MVSDYLGMVKESHIMKLHREKASGKHGDNYRSFVKEG